MESENKNKNKVTFNTVFKRWTPLDFSMLTGLRCRGFPIPWFREVHRLPDTLQYYLGFQPHDEHLMAEQISCTALRKYYRHFVCTTEAEEDILTRAFLLYLLGASIFSSVDNTVHLGWIAALTDLEVVNRYDWGGAGLATLYGYMSGIAHGIITRTGGFYPIWEMWLFEYFSGFRPQSSLDTAAFPRGQRWIQGRMSKRVGMKDTEGLRRRLDATRAHEVDWYPWTSIPAHLTRSQRMAQRRILLEGPLGREWYLGERVMRQSHEYNYFPVPQPPPSSMRATGSLSGEELRLALKGHPATRYQAQGDYDAFRSAFLMRPFFASTSASASTGGTQARPSRALRRDADDEREDGSSDDEEIPQSITLTDVYGLSFEHCLQPVSQTGSSSGAQKGKKGWKSLANSLLRFAKGREMQWVRSVPLEYSRVVTRTPVPADEDAGPAPPLAEAPRRSTRYSGEQGGSNQRSVNSVHQFHEAEPSRQSVDSARVRYTRRSSDRARRSVDAVGPSVWASDRPAGSASGLAVPPWDLPVMQTDSWTLGLGNASSFDLNAIFPDEVPDIQSRRTRSRGSSRRSKDH